MKKVLIGFLIVVFVYSGVLIFITGIYQKNTHQDVYNHDYYKGFSDIRKQLISLAILAPSSHNMQPWRVLLDKDDSTLMDLFIEDSRVLPVVDENYNQMVISCGTFLAYLVKAGYELGYDVKYVLFPLGDLPENLTIEEVKTLPIARISVIELESKEHVSIDAFTSATSKGIYNSLEIDNSILDQIEGYQNENITIRLINDDTSRLKELLIKGVMIESKHEEAMRETSSIFRYISKEKNSFGYGLSMNSGFSNSFILNNVELINKLLPMDWQKEGEYWLKNEIANINSCSAFGIIFGENTRISQIESGIALGHIYYLLKKLEISVQPIVQVTEIYEEMKDLRVEFNNMYANGLTSHIIFRFGYVDKESLHSIRLTPYDIIDEN